MINSAWDFFTTSHHRDEIFFGLPEADSNCFDTNGQPVYREETAANKKQPTLEPKIIVANFASILTEG
jgi:hypothetical protein